MVVYLKTNGRKEKCWGEREKMSGGEFQADFILPRVGYSRVLLQLDFFVHLLIPRAPIYRINYLVYRSADQ